MKKISYLILSAIAFLPVALTSCSSNDDDYTPGPEVSDDCPVVYFSNENESEIFVTSEDNSVSVKMLRQNTEGAVTVPVVVDSKSDGMTIPESVTFADGESEAELIISYAEFQGGMNFKVHVSDEYADPYAVLPGSVYYAATLAQLNKICTAKFTDAVFSSVENTIYGYEGENKFLWENFLNSGVDLVFTVDTSDTYYGQGEYDPDDITKLKGSIVPLTNYTNDDEGSGWFLTNGIGTSDYVVWTHANGTISSRYFWYTDGCAYIDFDPAGYGCGWGQFYNTYPYDSQNEAWGTATTAYFYLYY